MVKRATKRSFAQLLFAAVTVAFSLAILGLLLYRERALLFQLQWRFDPWLIGGAFFVYAIGLALASLIWANLMQHLGSSISYRTHIHYFCISHLAKRLPGTLWYIAGRTYLYKQADESLRLVTFATSLELLITFLSGCLTSLLFAGYALAEQTSLPLWSWFVLVGGGLLCLHPTSLHYLLRRFDILEAPQLQYRQLLLWVTLYVLIWMIGGSVLYGVTNVVTAVSPTHLTYFIGSWSVIGTLSFLVFFLPTNLGFTEVGLSLLLATVIPSSLAVVVAVVNRIFLLLCEIIGIPAILLLLRFWPQSSTKK